MSKSLYFSLAASLAIASGAAAQCNIHRYGVPDFDQKRTNVDNNGSMYCVPTSSLNWMAYIANHGDTSLMGHSSSNWASNSEFSTVTSHLNSMGDYSDTSGSGGTSLGDAVEGIADYMDNHGVNGFYIICGWKAHDNWAPSPRSFYNHMVNGELVNMIFGYYDLSGGEWDRDGGHCMTVVGVENGCGTHPIVQFHNPNNDSSLSTQAAFETGSWTCEKYTSNFDGDVRGQWQKVGSSGSTNRRFIDKMISIIPVCGVSLPAARSNGIQFHRLSPLNNEQSMSEETVPTPGDASVVNAFPWSREPGAIVLTRRASTDYPARLYFYDSVDHVWNILMTFPTDPVGLLQDRFGAFYINLGTTMQKVRMGDGSVIPVATITPRYTIDGMAFNDATDTLELLASGRRHTLSYPGGDLLASPVDRALPAAATFSGTPFITYNPKMRRIYVGAADSPSIWGLDPLATAVGWQVGETIPVPTGFAGILSAQFVDRGDLALLSRNGYGEFRRTFTSANWAPVPNPLFGGRIMNGFMNILRNSSDFNPVTDTLAQWHNIDNPVVDDSPVRECRADFNFDGTVDFFDYLDFVDAFSTQNWNSDFNFDFTLDFFDYLDFVDAFSNGC